jgi:cytochrome b6-f complex iron-sulfur subunit
MMSVKAFDGKDNAGNGNQKAGWRGRLTRKDFLGIGFVGALAALAGQTGAALLSFLKPVNSGGFGGMIYAGKVEEFPIGSASRILTGRFFITHTEDGLLAVWQRCTHLGCAVPWDDANGEFHCPCHGSIFNTVGEVTGGPAPRPMDTFPITIKNGEVWVDTSKPTERSAYDKSQAAGV